MKQFFNGQVTLHVGDCLEKLKEIPDSSVDSCVVDPPYHLTSIVKRFGADNAAPVKKGKTGAYARASKGFMGRTWDGGDIAFRVELWREVFRVLKPGAYLLAFSGTRTYHRMACAIEDAGFDVRDRIEFDHDSEMEIELFENSLNEEQRRQFEKLFRESSPGNLSWRFGVGFPKSHDVSKGIDAKLLHGASRTEEMRKLAMGDDYEPSGRGRVNYDNGGASKMNGNADNKKRPITPEAQEWEGWGTALKPAVEPICMARKPLIGSVADNVLQFGTGAINIDDCRIGDSGARNNGRKVDSDICGKMGPTDRVDYNMGRFPANVIHDGSEEVVAAFPESDGQNGYVGPEQGDRPSRGIYGDFGARPPSPPRGDTGSAARFFYSAKADAHDRAGSGHPTVKPVDLMRYLVRLVTRKGGTVLDMFAGTGTTGEAAYREGMNAILIEREEEYARDIERRMSLVNVSDEERRIESLKARNKIEENAGPLFA